MPGENQTHDFSKNSSHPLVDTGSCKRATIQSGAENLHCMGEEKKKRSKSRLQRILFFLLLSLFFHPNIALKEGVLLSAGL